jgi:septum site-determining protein MinC
MKAKQKTIRIFELEVEDESQFFDYMEKNIILLKDYFLLIQGNLTNKMREYLEEKGVCFKEADSCKLKISSKSNTPKKNDTIPKEEFIQAPQKLQMPQEEEVVPVDSTTLLYEKPIRSGEEIIHEGDITIFGRVNSAAKVLCTGNVRVFGRIDGLVQCDGEYMIAQEVGKGYIIFNGDILEKELFDGKLKKITRSQEGAVVKDIF